MNNQNPYKELADILFPYCHKRIKDKVRELEELRKYLDLSKLSDIIFRRLREIYLSKHILYKKGSHDSLEDEVLKELELVESFKSGLNYPPSDFNDSTEYFSFILTTKGLELYRSIVKDLYKEVFPIESLPSVQYVYIDRETGEELDKAPNVWD